MSMISAACPRCHILVVEGNSPSTPDLAATERTAARLGAQVISNSYGTGENGFSLPFRRAYQPRGRTVVASSGDSGFTDAAVPGRPAHRHLGRRHHAGPGAQPPRLARAGLAATGRRGRQRLLGLDRQARLAARHALPGADDRRHLRGGQRTSRYSTPPTAAGSPSRGPAPRPRWSPGSSAWPATAPAMTTARLYRHAAVVLRRHRGQQRTRAPAPWWPAAPTTCASRRRATTRPPAWARRTGPVVCKGGRQGSHRRPG